MKRFTRKSIMEASVRYRNEQAVLRLARIDELGLQEYERKPLLFRSRKTTSPFKIGSLWLSILP